MYMVVIEDGGCAETLYETDDLKEAKALCKKEYESMASVPEEDRAGNWEFTEVYVCDDEEDFYWKPSKKFLEKIGFDSGYF